MDQLSQRALTSQLAEDLTWLEEHSRHRTRESTLGTVEQAVQTSELRLAAALVRNCIGPALDRQPAMPLHIAVIGGAGAGKSTIANLLLGTVSAEANPQAGFTRHPIVYTTATGALNWAGHLGFLGPLQRAPQPMPSSIDADIYQVRRVPPDPTGFELLRDAVVWDCPDMTTWAAMTASTHDGKNGQGYLARLIEVTALADVLVYVTSDERYNDEVPTQFLYLLLQTGKPVIVCLTKMKEAHAEPMLDHFRKEVLRHLPPGVVNCLAVPYLTADQRQDPIHQAARYRIPLLNQVGVLTHAPVRARRRTLVGALGYLQRSHERLLAVARHDVTALENWRALVQRGEGDYNQRYQQEYLCSERFRGFDEALVRLMDLLELPGVGKPISGVLWLARTPYRLLRTAIGKALSRPEGLGLPELPVLEQALTGWIDQLRKEAARQAATHQLWAHVANGFASAGLADQIRDRFQQGYRTYQMSLSTETERTARAIYEQLEQRPAMLNTLRGVKFGIDALAIMAALMAPGPLWSDLLLVPVATSVSHQLVELLGKGYVDSQRELTRQRQMGLLTENISGPLADWLAKWPATGGSPFERLQTALRRIPPALEQLHTLIHPSRETN